MLYPKEIEVKIGFDRIRSLLREHCISDLGKSVVDQISFSHDRQLLEKLLTQTSEFAHILIAGEPFPSNHFFDVSASLARARAEGAFLSEDEFLHINNSLKTITSCATFLGKRREEFPFLFQLNTLVNFDGSIIEEINEKIDEGGYVKDVAGSLLADVRKKLRGKHAQVRRALEAIYKHAVREGFVPEGASLTVRDGRMVIPVTAEYKKRIKGFVHDESATGQTVYLEPAEVLEGNNEIRELENAEKREVIKILTALTNLLRENLPEIKMAYQYLSLIDFIRAKARLAIELKAVLPLLTTASAIQWKNARHPLLYHAYAASKKHVVPLTIELSEEQRIIVISGPNAGGKSVCLKTVALLQYMLQCGLLVPMHEDSSAGIFENIFIDIGDEQSIENDLSTYSSHLSNMKYFISHINSRSLCLIDEFGTGTDPHYGGAIAEAILEKLVALNAYGVITTHYSNIKHYAENKPGVVNGAMKYDIEHLEPLYELEIGKPGSSFSLEIARKIGLSTEVIQYAKEIVGSKNMDVDDLILKLEKQTREIERKEAAALATDAEVRILKNKYDKLYTDLEGRKKEIIDQAKREAAGLLAGTNRLIEKTIRHIKENKAEKTETRKVRERLDDLKRQVKIKEEPVKAESIVIPGAIVVGDTVRLTDNQVTGEVIGIKGKDVEVKVGDLKTVVKRKRLEKISKGKAREIKRNLSQPSGGFNINQHVANFQSTLDVRGKRGEEVLPLVDKFLDNALLSNMSEIRILHGKGNGILKDLIRNYLQDSPMVDSIKDEHVERGGAGISVVNLK